MPPEERYTKRLEQEKPVLDSLLAWANGLMPKMVPKSALGKALHYLEDGRLKLSNNRAERSIKPLVMGQEKLSLCKHAGGCTLQCCHLQQY